MPATTPGSAVSARGTATEREAQGMATDTAGSGIPGPDLPPTRPGAAVTRAFGSLITVARRRHQ